MEAGTGKNFDETVRAFLQIQFKLYTRASFEDPNAEFISVKDLGDCLRMCGFAPFESEIAEMGKMADPEETGRLNFDTFLDVVFYALLSTHTQEQLVEAFRFFDHECRTMAGSVSLTDMRYFLTNYGEKLTDAEMNEFAAEAASEIDIGDGTSIKYEALAKKFMPKFLSSM